MAGSFGYEQGHYEVSHACGERVLFPAVREAAADDLVVAPGFSCRHQTADFCDNPPEPAHGGVAGDGGVMHDSQPLYSEAKTWQGLQMQKFGSIMRLAPCSALTVSGTMQPLSAQGVALTPFC